METITSADGTNVSWQTTGSGPPLLLVHGTTADHTRWAGVSPQFEQHFTVHAMDRRGRGASTDDAQVYGILREAEDVAAVVDAIGGRVDVLGHSYGAVCSLEAALLTDAVRKMVLYEPPLPTGVQMYPPGLPDRMQGMIDDGELEAALELFFREVVKMPDHELVEYRELPVWKQRIHLAPTIPREMAIDRSYSFDSEKFADLRVPILLMLGGDSPPIFQAAIETAEAALPSSRVVLLPGQKHIAMDTDPELFVGEVLDFLLD
jgi:pimeloyl-ACP methyl ester carboxylesterase